MREVCPHSSTGKRSEKQSSKNDSDTARISSGLAAMPTGWIRLDILEPVHPIEVLQQCGDEVVAIRVDSMYMNRYIFTLPFR